MEWNRDEQGRYVDDGGNGCCDFCGAVVPVESLAWNPDPNVAGHFCPDCKAAADAAEAADRA